MNIPDLIIFFIIYSFAGWFIEIIYRSIENRQCINPGFLFGPFLPIYGFSAVTLIILSQLIQSVPLVIKIIIYFFVTTIGEYTTGFIFEKFLGMKLWDYSQEKFNFQGRVSLKFSLIWTLTAYIGLHVIHPFLITIINMIRPQQLFYISLSISIIIVIDILYSFAKSISFKQKVSLLLNNFQSLENFEIENIFKSIRHLLNSFPNLKRSLQEKMDLNLKNRFVSKFKDFIHEMDIRASKKQPLETEYISLVEDILKNKEFNKLKNFQHHHNSTTYNHAKKVSYLAYKVAKQLGLDVRATARGGLLHDFYLYDWHKEEGRPYKNKLHGFEHPKIALQNAEKNFSLTDKERDIIIKHMWPLTIKPPRYKESFVVTFVDKYVSSKEFLERMKNSKITKKIIGKFH